MNRPASDAFDAGRVDTRSGAQKTLARRESLRRTGMTGGSSANHAPDIAQTLRNSGRRRSR
jgi:hypothetical protein